MSNCEFVAFPLVSWVRCGTWLYQFRIFVLFLTLVWACEIEFADVGKKSKNDLVSKNYIILTPATWIDYAYLKIFLYCNSDCCGARQLTINQRASLISKRVMTVFDIA